MRNYPLGQQQARALELIREYGALTAHDLADELGLGLVRAYTLLYSLEERQLVAAKRGRRPTMWTLSEASAVAS